MTFDCRYPVFFNPETIGETVQRRLAPAGYALEPIKPSVPHHVPESSELVSKLMDVYNTITGESAKPFAIGGGTYARHLKEGVAYGMMFPGELELEHQANEASMWRTSLKPRVSMRMLSSPCAHKRRKRICCHIMRR